MGEVRGQGLIAAVEFVAATTPSTRFDAAQRIGARIARASRERGVITRALPAADTIAFSPPLIVTESEIDAMVDVTRPALDEVAKELA